MEPHTSLPNLLCEENESSLKENKDGFPSVSVSVSESDCEFIETLFQCEVSFQADSDVNSVWTERCWFGSVRSNVIKWILEKRALFGYHYRTAYLSLIYFDRFLTRKWISYGKLLKIQILSIACLSLAAKMEECQVRPLRDYAVEGYQFLQSSITRMELIVLNTLEWRMSCVTPFSFLYYFAAMFCGECGDKETMIIRANKLVFAMMREIDASKHRPSVIAAAVVLATYDNHLTEVELGSKVGAVTSWGSIEREHTISCYSLVQEILEMDTPESVISHNSLNPKVDDSSTMSRSPPRRRLNFDDCDQDRPPHKISRS